MYVYVELQLFPQVWENKSDSEREDKLSWLRKKSHISIHHWTAPMWISFHNSILINTGSYSTTLTTLLGISILRLGLGGAIYYLLEKYEGSSNFKNNEIEWLLLDQQMLKQKKKSKGWDQLTDNWKLSVKARGIISSKRGSYLLIWEALRRLNLEISAK